MLYPKFASCLAILILLVMVSGCSGGSGGSSQGFYGQVVDCTIGGTSDDPPDGTQFSEYTFTISGIASGTEDPITGDAGPRPDNFLVYQEDVMPAGLRLDPAGNSDGNSDIDVIGTPWAAGFQTIRVLASDADNESCYTTFEFLILVEECDLALSPEGEEGDPTPVDVATGTVGEFLTGTIDRTITVGTTDQVTVFFSTEFFDDTGTPFDPFTEFPVPGMGVTIDPVSEGLAPIEVSGIPSSIGTFIFTVRVSASAAESDPSLDPSACVVEETYSITVETATP